jgi:hypothetical protein
MTMKRKRRRRTQHRRWPVKPVLLALAAILLVASLAYVFARQERARRVVVGNNGTITVKAGGDVQSALERAKPGDTILLEAGATFRGALRLPNKPGGEYITIRSSATDAQLPAPGERLDPARYASVLPKIISDTVGEAAVTATGGAHHYRFIAVEFGATPKGEGNIIALGTTEEKSLNELPHDIELDRVYVHGSPTEGQRRGLALNGRRMRVINSYFADIKRKGEESQAICGWGGDGPFEITNNYLEAGTQGVLFGGAMGNFQVIPSDIIVRDNYFNKPLHWREEGWVVKNHLELKNARRVKIENNLMTNNWVKGQDGTAVLFTVREDSGPSAIVEDVEFTGNIVRGAGGAFSIYGGEGKGGHRLIIRNNIFEDINGEHWGGDGQFMTITQWDGLTVEGNTIFTSGNITKAYGNPVTGFIFRHNIVPQNNYGFIGDDRAPGVEALNTYFPGSVVSYNAFVGGDASRYPGRNMFPASFKQLKFVNLEGGDYRLRADSPLKRAGMNGADIGANLDPQAVGRSH